MEIYALSFGSEGAPHDAGLTLGKKMLEEWGKMIIGGGASSYEYYTPRMFRDCGEE